MITLLFLPPSHASVIAMSKRKGEKKIMKKKKLPWYRETWKWYKFGIKPCACSNSI